MGLGDGSLMKRRLGLKLKRGKERDGLRRD